MAGTYFVFFCSIAKGELAVEDNNNCKIESDKKYKPQEITDKGNFNIFMCLYMYVFV